MTPLKTSVTFFFCLLMYVNISGQAIDLKTVASGFSKPVCISSSGIVGDDRLFIVEKSGQIKILQLDGVTLPTPFLNIKNRVNAQDNERGLLGLCFHPLYKENGYFFVNYTNTSGHTTISRFTRSSSDSNTADAATEKILLVIEQPYTNHNGGDIKFGDDGFLYIGMGDGGKGGDPENRSQNPATLLGKMLRIDVNTENEKYLIPSDNPYTNSKDTLKEIWSMGLRNPWRFSFDHTNNALWIADVGQNKYEEINVAKADAAGLNYGWRCYEGQEKYNASGCKDAGFYYFPVHTYDNSSVSGCSVTGGYVYRGKQNTDLIGKYIYTDYCSGLIQALYKDSNESWVNDVIYDKRSSGLATFGEDNNKELYVANLNSGIIYTIHQKTTGINPGSHNPVTFSIADNPATRFLTIQTSGSIQPNSKWIICNTAGITVKSWIEKGSNTTFSIDINDLTEGAYILYNESIQQHTQKFIKI